MLTLMLVLFAIAGIGGLIVGGHISGTFGSIQQRLRPH